MAQKALATPQDGGARVGRQPRGGCNCATRKRRGQFRQSSWLHCRGLPAGLSCRGRGMVRRLLRHGQDFVRSPPWPRRVHVMAMICSCCPRGITIAWTCCGLVRAMAWPRGGRDIAVPWRFRCLLGTCPRHVDAMSLPCCRASPCHCYLLYIMSQCHRHAWDWPLSS